MNSELPVYHSKDELLKIAKTASGHRFSEYDINNRLSSKNKGCLGQIIEEGLFKYPINCRAEADFANLGVELKVTGMKLSKKKEYSSKERLVLNIINYMEEYNIEFEDSSFLKKSQELLLMFYYYDLAKINDYNFLIVDSVLHKFSDNDLAIMEHDWNIIQDKIKNGKAETISEADTMYLGACRKGAGGEKDLRDQPNSDLKAPQRAYCLKQSYIDYIILKNEIHQKCKDILNESLTKVSVNETLISDGESFNGSFIDSIQQKLSKYIGMSEDELSKLFIKHSERKNKNKYENLIADMLGIKGLVNDCEEFVKANIILKTFRITEKRSDQQHMSFPVFKYTAIVNEEWHESELFHMFYSTKFLIAYFEEINGKFYFMGVKLWNMPLTMIEEKAYPIWKSTVDCLKSGNVIRKVTPNKMYVHLPTTSSKEQVVHVRPHSTQTIAKGPQFGFDLPVPDKLTGLTKFTKYSFWLDRDFVISLLKEKES